MLNASTIDQIAKQLKEPDWVTELRRKSLARHAELAWPHSSDDIWRRVDVRQLDPSRGFEPALPQLLQRIALTQSQLDALIKPLADEHLLVRVNGSWLTEAKPADGLIVEDGIAAMQKDPQPIRRAIEADGLTEAEQKLSSLNLAFHHDDVSIQVPAGFAGAVPLRLVHLLSAGPNQALFPLTVITVGAGASITLIDEYVSVSESGQPHLINGRIELVLEPDSNVHYIRLQRWAPQAREFLLQRATLERGATMTMANINLGAALSKAHLITKLNGERSSTNLYGFIFGKDKQHVDQHTLQDHRAPRTSSDLHFNAALQDESRLTYTGLIRIGKEAVQTVAYQANHNLMLSRNAKAETIPMLEILADDVQCKHGASVSPIDEEQAFYLMSRGIKREAAQRLIVMGFVESIIERIPFAPLQQQLREEIEGAIHEEQAAGAV